MSDDGNDRPWWHGAVIYQIFPRSFLDTDGDGVGDLRGITRKLDHVASLGVDAVWLSPFYPSPNRDWGYDLTAHCKVDPVYGDMDDFDALVARAHDLGLKVCIDAVLNHTSDLHPWFVESRAGRDGPKADWYQWQDPKADGSPPNNWISRYGRSQWSWCPEREQYYRHQYLPTQPSLNLANDEVVEERLKFMRKWLDRGVDGLRFDAVPQYYSDAKLTDNPPCDPRDDEISPLGAFNPFAWQLHVNDCNDPRVEGFVARLQDEVECAGCTFTFSEIDIRHDAYRSLGRYTGGDQFNAAYTPDFMEAKLLPSNFARAMDSAARQASLQAFVWTATNHDSSRLASRWSPEGADEETRAKVAKLAAAILACLPGPVTFFQGEELGLPDAPYDFEELKDPQGIQFWPRAAGRDPIRHPFPWDGGHRAGFTEDGEPWLPLKEAVTCHHAAGQEADEDSVLNTWRRLLRLRRDTPALRYGDCQVLEADDERGLLRLQRTQDDVVVVAVFSTGEEAPDVRCPDGEVLDASGDDPLEAWGWRIVKLS
jgi:alpha-glucosidase